MNLDINTETIEINGNRLKIDHGEIIDDNGKKIGTLENGVLTLTINQAGSYIITSPLQPSRQPIQIATEDTTPYFRRFERRKRT